ncbi:MAG: DUF763 domain-containing protein [Candidatus Aenigmarchaeota archaeon]|nr:DUF763 domain-containing protein [Candidatus Aenigmarchaeota archaeon]
MKRPKRRGVVELRLARGPVPHYKEMVTLSGPIIEAIANEFGTKEVIKRFSDPLWFQSFACLLGFEWNYSGMTTVTMKAVKEALNKVNIGLKVVGGKGKNSKATREIPKIVEKFSIKSKKEEDLSKASRLTCKVDTNEMQDGYNLYFHSMIIDEKGNYTVINQKMSTSEKMVRRFHWVDNPEVFVEEPYSAIAGIRQKMVIDLTSKESRDTRKTILDIVRDELPEKIQRTILMLNKKKGQTKIFDYLNFQSIEIVKLPYYFKIPEKISLQALKIAKNANDFEEFLLTRGIGPELVRGLTFVAHIIYGSRVSWKDPIKYTFAHGTKAGKPWFVEKEKMLREAEILKQAIQEAKIGKNIKVKALQRLTKMTLDSFV